MVAAPPTLTPHDEASLLADVLAGDASIAEIAAKHNIALPLFLDWLATVQTRTRITAALDAEDAALHRKHQAARAKAIDKLTRIIDETEDPVEARRAASALLRPIHRRPNFRPPDKLSTFRSLLGPIKEPHPDDSPQDVITRTLARLQHNDNPHEGAGLEQLFASLSESARSALADSQRHPRAHADPQAFARAPGLHHRLTNFTTALLYPLETESSPLIGGAGEYKTASQTMTLTYPDHSTRSFTLHLDLDQHDYADYWRITSITELEGEVTPPDSS